MHGKVEKIEINMIMIVPITGSSNEQGFVDINIYHKIYNKDLEIK